MNERSRWPARRGWKQVRREEEVGFKPDFAPLRLAIRRNELFGSVVELFFSALVGVGRLNLGAEEPENHSTEKSDDDLSDDTLDQIAR